jgi:hypothetical protein
MSYEHNAGQNLNVKVNNKYFESVRKFKYVGRPQTNNNCIREEVKMKFRECLLPSGPECFVFCVAI